MKNATILLSLFAGAMLTSCAGISPTRVIGDTAGAAGGALIGHAISKDNPMADFFGKSRQVNGTFARSARAEAPKKRFLSSDR